MLLFARGLGTNGEMDAVAQEEADLIAWLEEQKARRGVRPAQAASQAHAQADGESRASAQQEETGVWGEEERIGGVPAAELDAAFRSALGAHPRSHLLGPLPAQC